MRTLLPVRSADIKHGTGRLVLRWVTTGEYLAVVCFCILFLLVDDNRSRFLDESEPCAEDTTAPC